MSNWIEEALQAPKDAWALLTGLASAFSILALIQHEFSTEPLRVVVRNWSFWSQAFWPLVIPVEIAKPIAELLTAAVFSWIVVGRGILRRQGVLSPWTLVLGLMIVGLVTSLLKDLVPLFLPNAFPSLDTPQNAGAGVFAFLVLCIGLTTSVVVTPRSFFGVVIAGLLLLLIDRIPILPATGT